MCDTQVIHTDGVTWFAKNSDREPSEAQFVVRLPRVENDQAALVQTTYMNIPQTARRHGVILSKPHWIWGAEMGVNDQGVAIGNEAIFSHLVDRSAEALLGMDLLRLGLERGYTARHALEVITEHLQEYGQGGPAGFRDKNFRYDNSYIIADREEAWILETAGKLWAARCVGRHADLGGHAEIGAISNCLTIGSDYDLAAPDLEDQARKLGFWNGRGEFNFREAFDTWFLPHFGGAHHRRATSIATLEACAAAEHLRLAHLCDSLRRHRSESENFARHDNRDVCLHAGGRTRPSQTCGSMVARLSADTVDDYLFTGSSAPCLSLFKPVDFNDSIRFHFLQEEDDGVTGSYWHRQESIHRRALFNLEFRDEYRQALRDVETEILCWIHESNPTQGADEHEADEIARQWHETWHKEAALLPLETDFMSFYGHFWRNLNRLDTVL